MPERRRRFSGADADLVVFDPERVTDQATYVESTRPSSGVMPGRPTRGVPA